MVLEDNINKEHIRLILTEYEQSHNFSAIGSAISKIGYPTRYSTFLLLAILSEWAFTDRYKSFELISLKTSEHPGFEDILDMSLGEYYPRAAPRLCHKDKPREIYAGHLGSVILDAEDSRFIENLNSRFERDEAALPQYLQEMSAYFRYKDDTMKSEFARALNVAEGWLAHNESIAALFLDYAMLRLDWHGSIDYIKVDSLGANANSKVRKKILNSAKGAGLNLNEDEVVTPEEFFYDGCDEKKEMRIIEEQTKKKAADLKKVYRTGLLSLEDRLKSKVFEQDHAIEAVTTILFNKESGMGNPDRAYGMLFIGPSGVGKTELARQLNECLYSGQSLLKIDCTEYAQDHYIANLIGSPPGYVGSQELGMLPAFIREHPECVILFDEIEKAHEKVRNFLLTLLDSKNMIDNHHETYDVAKVIVIMTSNAGNVGPEANKRVPGFNADQKQYAKQLREEAIKETFPPAFLGRCHIVHFGPLSYEGVVKVFDKKLRFIQDNAYRLNKVHVEVTEKARDQIIIESDWTEYGARNVEGNLEKKLTLFSKAIVEGALVKPEGYVVLDYGSKYMYGIRGSKDAVIEYLNF